MCHLILIQRQTGKVDTKVLDGNADVPPYSDLETER
jgi:hypothetical protein